MFVHAIKTVRKAVFPIFRVDQIAQNQARLGVVGTGFFISANGNFVSVAHIFDNNTDKTKFMYFGELPENLENPKTDIEEVARDDGNDIFIGRVKKKTPDFLRLSAKVPYLTSALVFRTIRDEPYKFVLIPVYFYQYPRI